MGRATVAALVVASGMAVGGWFVGAGFVESRTADRFVTVKGVAERDVMADLALWPLLVVASGDDLPGVQAEIDDAVREVYSFLARHGVDTTQIYTRGLEVMDRLNPQAGGIAAGGRYQVEQRVMVRSDDPAGVQAASQSVGELVGAGVVLRSGTGWGPARPTYLFRRLNDLKPEMIAEATAAARESAMRFADDSDTGLGKIRRANQGVFQILPRDAAAGITQEEQMFKTLRVVTTVEFQLN